jgi:hypothetical protein
MTLYAKINDTENGSFRLKSCEALVFPKLHRSERNLLSIRTPQNLRIPMGAFEALIARCHYPGLRFDNTVSTLRQVGAWCLKVGMQ